MKTYDSPMNPLTAMQRSGFRGVVNRVVKTASKVYGWDKPKAPRKPRRKK